MAGRGEDCCMRDVAMPFLVVEVQWKQEETMIFAVESDALLISKKIKHA
jgi:hypothetical protein